MAKLPRKVLVVYIGPKSREEDVITGDRDENGDLIRRYFEPEKPQFVSRESAGKLLYYPNLFKDARTEDAIRKEGPIELFAPVDHRYEDLDAETESMPLIDVKKLDARGIVSFAGLYLGRRLDIDEKLPVLREQLDRAIEGKRFEWA